MLPPINNSRPSELTMKLWNNITNFDTPLILSPKWSKQNDIEVAVKLRGELMGGIYACRTRQKFHYGGMSLYYCEVAGNPNGTMTALVIGNSFSMNIIAAVSSNPIFSKTISIWTNGRNFPMHDGLETYFMEHAIKAKKPDVTFIVQRYFHKYLYDTPIDKIPEHPEFKHWNKILETIQNYTSAIIMNKEQVVFPYDISQDYIRRRFYDLYLESRLKNPQKSETMDAWFSALNCSKCAFFDYRSFCDGNFCNIIDLATGLPLFRDTEHISPIGLRFLKPFIDSAINKALKIE
uniref:SGNH domain-containing protein n=1 Tax=Panagrolaimus sp. PS1159 TaxID=55785 RepID=A0AC35FHF2_9BILA